MKKYKVSTVNVLTNLALSALLVSVAAVCLYPAQPTVTTEGGETEIYRCAQEDSDGVSLMFNVYWGTEEVYQILDILSEYDATATFFIGGCWADDNVQCVKAIFEAGHELGNHGYFHKDHKKLSEKENEKEIAACNQFLFLSTGVTPTLFAPPSGSYGKDSLAACRALNMKTVLWSRDTVDWRDKDADLVYRRATRDIKGGEFVLLHPMEHTVKALGNILKFYQSCGLKAISVSENLQRKE